MIPVANTTMLTDKMISACSEIQFIPYLMDALGTQKIIGVAVAATHRGEWGGTTLIPQIALVY
jgi:hypothetical protein